jgi:hypothetical protein
VTATRREVLAALALAVPGCGYALVGRGTVVDPSIKRIGVPRFENGTPKAGLDQKITERVIEELLKRGRFDVTEDRAGVDALVEGALTRYDAQPVGFESSGGTTQASRYSITLTARVRYAKSGATEAIWANEAFSFRDEYEMGTDPATFFDREEQALERLAQQFARSLVAAMLEAF